MVRLVCRATFVQRLALVALSATGASCGRSSFLDQPFDDLQPQQRRWLVTVDTNAYQVYAVDVQAGQSQVLCSLPNDGARYTSAAFGTDHRMMVTYKVDGSRDADIRLAELDPCTCERRPIGRYVAQDAVAGLVFTNDGRLHGLRHGTDELVAIDPQTGTTTTVGPLGVDVHTNGASLSDVSGQLTVLDGRADRLYRVDTTTGQASLAASMSMDFGSVGLELEPTTGRLYACTDDAVLYEIDQTQGRASAVGTIDMPGNCGSLAAPTVPIACIDGLADD